MEATNDEPYSQFPEDNLQYKLQKAYFDKPLLSEIQRRNITNDKLKAKLVETLFAKLGSYPDFQKIEVIDRTLLANSISVKILQQHSSNLQE